jgi:hypothetical protein
MVWGPVLSKIYNIIETGQGVLDPGAFYCLGF